MDRADLAGLELERLLGGSSSRSNQGASASVERDGLRLVEVVGDDDRDADLVAAGQGDGQVEVDEERLEDPDRRLRRAEPAVGRDGAGGEPPGGDRVGQVDVERRRGPGRR